MKKEYIKPEMELTLIEAEEMIASSLQDGKYENGDGDPLSHGRRGTWGNLWSEGEE